MGEGVLLPACSYQKLRKGRKRCVQLGWLWSARWVDPSAPEFTTLTSECKATCDTRVIFFYCVYRWSPRRTARRWPESRGLFRSSCLRPDGQRCSAAFGPADGSGTGRGTAWRASWSLWRRRTPGRSCSSSSGQTTDHAPRMLIRVDTVIGDSGSSNGWAPVSVPVVGPIDSLCRRPCWSLRHLGSDDTCDTCDTCFAMSESKVMENWCVNASLKILR